MIGRVRRQAFSAASQAYAAAAEGRDLIADIQDGFGVEVDIDEARMVACSYLHQLIDILASDAAIMVERHPWLEEDE